MKNILILTIIFTTFSTMAQNLKPITYTDGQTKHQAEAIIVSPNAPSVLVLPAWMGIDFEARKDAEMLSQKGYNIFIADIYGMNETPKDTEAAKKMSSYYKENPTAYHHKISVALKEFIKIGGNANNIAVIGYCFGGTGAIEAARANLPFKGIVSIHGGLKKFETTYNKIQSKVLIIHPAEDASVSKSDIDLFMDEMRKGTADWQLIYYGDSKHTFTNPKSADYNELMTKRAWQHILIFLDEVLNY